MALSINLRGDLAKLSDEELAARLKEAWDQYEAAEKRFHWWTARGWLLGKRGPVRHPRVYQFLAAVQHTDAQWVSLLFATALSHKDASGFVQRLDRNAGMHMSACEIQDIVDEIERRMEQRQDTKT
jgi:hypothetical protein